MYNKNTTCVRPECTFDIVPRTYFSPNVNLNPEHMFVREGITYDYSVDWEKWNHIESTPILDPSKVKSIIAENGPTELHRRNHSYGYDHSSRFSVGNPLFNWYSNTELDIEMMKRVKEVRKPIIEKIKEAKKKEDTFKQWSVYNFIKNEFPETEIQSPEDPEVKCEEVVKAINEIPLECERIEEVLGSQYSGSDMNNYWWYGWLPAHMLSESQPGIIDLPFSGSTFAGAGEGVTVKQTHFPPYQTSIGAYNCADIEISEDEDMKVVEGTNRPPYYGVFGGFTADVCGCVELSKSSFPSYIETCNFPSYGEKYPEYLEYIRSVDARFWNTPKLTPLLRQAQLKTLMMQNIQIVVPGDMSIRTGSIVAINVPQAHTGAGDLPDGKSSISGKYLVLRVKHSFNSSNIHTSKLTLVRDSKPE